MEEKEKKNEVSSCCAPRTSCCEPSESETNYNKSKIKLNSSEKIKDPNKLLVDIYVPLEACACEWSKFMNLIFSALTPYIKYIKFDTKSLTSDEARRLNLHSKCVIIDGEKKYTTSYALKKNLPNLLKQKGLI